jgi:hypothetical protein
LENAHEEHGSPYEFYKMEYTEFLAERRKKIAVMIKEMFNRI